MPIFYLLQILDRVLSSRSIETLVMLTIIVIFSIIIEAVLSNLRSRLLTRSNIVIQKLLGPTVFRAYFQGKKCNTNTIMVTSIKIGSFWASDRIFAFFDLPWIPFFIIVLYLFHPSIAGESH